jgi:hypothetical protein
MGLLETPFRNSFLFSISLPPKYGNGNPDGKEILVP